jgi:hypothetical protein
LDEFNRRLDTIEDQKSELEDKAREGELKHTEKKGINNK